ncbi:hypothetical protein K466DRAFT_665936 [Polyporus arcularius HHB13444]|uniref:Uncharacterized protein n=1 Tax=Polyporus arcularius HHB13444 TaxID=1314778 RepID=A0A5C3P375_9APHY|nr:hypothetical protein K466DRAFT_665936 [Polyporus arcularius HHB13444]
MPTNSLLLPFLIYLGLIQQCTANFTFTYSEATECDDFSVSWTGGSPPFTLTIVPSFQVNIDIPIPDGAFSNNHGSYTTPMRLWAGNETVVVMSDSTGFGSGGVSPLIKVGNSVRHLTCDIQGNPGTDFDFSIVGALSQCNPMQFTEYANAIQPVHITGVVAGGSTFALNPANGSKSFTWVANIAAGTQVLFFMVDSKGRRGGTENVMTVLQSGGAACLDSSSPASAANPPSLTGTSTTATSTQTGTWVETPADSHVTTGTLVTAIVVPVVVAVMLAIGAILWYRRRRRNRGVRVLGGPQHPELDLTKGDTDRPHYMNEVGSPAAAIPFLHGRSPSADGTTGGYPSPLPTSASSSQFTASLSPSVGQSDSAPGPAYPYAGGTGNRPLPGGDSGARRKAAEAGMLRPPPPGQPSPATQFIVHTDIEDAVPSPIHEVVELPPQYSERRGTPHAASLAGSQPYAEPVVHSHVVLRPP